MSTDIELRQAQHIEPGDAGAAPASVNHSAWSSPKGSQCLDQVGRIVIALLHLDEKAASHFKGKAATVARKSTKVMNKPTKPLALDCPVDDQGTKRNGKSDICSFYYRHCYIALSRRQTLRFSGGATRPLQPIDTHQGASCAYPK